MSFSFPSTMFDLIKNQALSALMLELLASSLLVFGAVIAARVVMKYQRLEPYLRQLFTTADPIIKSHLPRLSSIHLYELIRKLAEGLSDGELSEKEIASLVTIFFSTFRLEANADTNPSNVGTDLAGLTNVSVDSLVELGLQAIRKV